MPLKIKQKKQAATQHPRYTANTGQHWADKYREENSGSFRKSFIAIIAIMVVIVIILVMAAITGIIQATNSEMQIDAADTFAVTSYEQEQMKVDAEEFAKGVLVYAYCSDESVAEEGKAAAKQLVASNSSLRDDIEALAQENPIVSADVIAPITTTPQLQTTTRAYAGNCTYEFSGVVADTSQTDDDNPYGTFIDNGYLFSVTFSPATDQASGETIWVISEVDISTK